MPTLPFRPPGTDLPTDEQSIPATAAEYDEGGAAPLDGSPEEEARELASTLPGMKRKRAKPTGRKSRQSIADHNRDTNHMKLRDKQILALRVAGAPIKEIQEQFGISRMTVHRSLTAAQKRAFQDFAIDKSLELLVPKALAAVSVKLDEGDAELGLEVLKGLGIFGKHVNVEQHVSGGTVETFEQLRTRIVRKTGVGADSPERDRDPGGAGGIIEASVVSAEEAADPQGNQASGHGDLALDGFSLNESPGQALAFIDDDEDGVED